MADDYSSIQGGKHSDGNGPWIRSSGGDSDQGEDFLQAIELDSLFSLTIQEIQKQLQTNSDRNQFLYNAALQVMNAKGAPIRGVLTLLCHQAIGGDIGYSLPIAAAIEFMNAANLIHNNMIGNTQKCINQNRRVYGDKITLLAGDLLLALAIRIIGELGEPELLQILGIGAIRTCEGEALKILSLNSRAQSESEDSPGDYSKPTSLLYESALIGAKLAGATDAQAKPLIQYVKRLNLAVQLSNQISLDNHNELEIHIANAKAAIVKGEFTKPELLMWFADYIIDGRR
ncbi:MAG: polyprenyl synthetase family protein [Candidatus Thorarchaeota archaeon]